MLGHINALVVVSALAFVVFVVARKAFLMITSSTDLTRRAAVWLGLTVVAFLSPSFWIYLVVAVPLVGWAAWKDSNPLALYGVLFFVIPPMELQLPTGGMLNLFYVNQTRLLGFVILVPVAFAAARRSDLRVNGPVRAVDWLLLVFGVIQIVQLIPYESITNTMRRTFLFGLDVYLVYYAFSRGIRDETRMKDVMAGFCLAAMVMAPMAAFESLRQWLLYTELARDWGAENVFAWLFRGDRLRAQAATGHALSLGYALAVALGFWLHLTNQHRTSPLRIPLAILFAIGVYFTFSRGPLITAAALVTLYVILRHRSAKRALAALLPVVAVLGGFLASPPGLDLLDNLPFIGTQGQETVDYRQQLAQTSWQLIQQNPLFGDPFALLHMEELRQGQGIIDLVNAYAGVALFHGLIGLSVFVGAFAAGLYATWSRFRSRSPELGATVETNDLGAVLLACMLSTLLFMGTAGNAWFQWVLLGMLTAYAAMTQQVEGLGASARPSALARQRPRASALS